MAGGSHTRRGTREPDTLTSGCMSGCHVTTAGLGAAARPVPALQRPSTIENRRFAPRGRTFIVPAAGVQVLPTWQAIGLHASASHAFEIRDLVVPDTHAFDIEPAAATQPGALYRFPFDALAYVTLAANLGGMARGFLRLATPLVLERPIGPARELLGTRARVRAQLQGDTQSFKAARGRCLERLDAAWERVEHDAGPVDEKALRDAALAWARTAREAVDGIYPLCGMAAADPRTALNRIWRDLHTGTQHAMLL